MRASVRTEDKAGTTSPLLVMLRAPGCDIHTTQRERTTQLQAYKGETKPVALSLREPFTGSYPRPS